MAAVSVGNFGSVKGFCDDRFSATRAAFERCFTELGETGAALSIYYAGELVCDLHGGIVKEGQAWMDDTLVMPYSVSKPFAALCCLILVDRGMLDVEMPVCHYWPEFGAAGKEHCTVRQLLEHQAGVPFAPPGCTIEDIYDVEGITSRLAAQSPTWPCGQVTAEHALLYGHLCGALVQRITGQSLGSFFRQEVGERFGIEMHFGLPEGLMDRCAEISAWPEDVVQQLRSLTPLAEAGLFVPDVMCTSAIMNSPQWRQAEIPAVNLHACARDIAMVYACLVNNGQLSGVRLLSPETVSLIQNPGEMQLDEVFGFESKWALGFQHHTWKSMDGLRDAGSHFGLGGIGGSSAFGSFECDVSFAYVTRQMGDWSRAEAVEEALLQSILSLKHA